ncbi:Nif11-like leader peptide family natural product precursor [Candidatus Methylobacter oryzae]|uniref:Nif11-like leader peptide family natural product n=1 Tax=Candidatus Methylobacter oryzae TaxID=2497749 RepID=A0ABY3C4L9_9GAMM|nr:Nif11-like leader peptide family natural product precursor [Candidatus Methylobacter oryzae]TRW89618.1 Nif11-like leader peptide family natural product precursor [Candidatus Methylobacter oryzae]
MSVESAIAYIKRMRSDEVFRSTVNACEDEQANWSYLKEQGFEFSRQEFLQARDAIYAEYGITPEF